MPSPGSSSRPGSRPASRRAPRGGRAPAGGATRRPGGRPSAAEIRRLIEEVARDRLGFDDLRPGQLEAIEAIASGRDALAILATGTGKTAIYEIAGHLVRGPTIVVSPMIALQQDQVEDLEERERGQAAQLNSTLTESERRDILEGFRRGDVEYLLLAPEQFADEDRVRALAEARPSILVVDEAHCISQWGHDFRPDYLRLADVVEELGRPTVLALTATASPAVRDEIVERLRLREPDVIVRGFDRPNIHLAVERFTDERGKTEALLRFVATAERPGIVYAATRRHVEDVADALRDQGIDAAAYHAGMKAAEREEVQTAFMEDRVDVIVATNAFGMGVDKPNVRFVLHYDIPGSIDAYYQEAGRAGRDGDPARALLLYRSEDLSIQRFFIGGNGNGGDEEKERHRRVERTRLDMMRGYAETGDCRREVLLNYFGERLSRNCGNCDNCEAGRSVEEGDGGAFPVGARVRHREWGEGLVQRYTGDTIVVSFDEMGYRTLSLAVVQGQGLLERVDP